MRYPGVIFIGTLLILVQSCAIIQAPTGGPKDIDPPKIKKCSPVSGSINYTGNAIKLDFDEFVVLNNLQQELIVSPPLRHQPEFKIKGKSVIILFKDTLEENTTYTFNLGAGIKDFHEGNILDSNIIVFSTGPEIDSGQVKGHVQDAFSLKPIEKALIMLYHHSDDSIPAKERPFYYSKSKSAGNYSIDHLKNGTYQLFVLEDKNGNYIYDLPNERIGFWNSDIDLGDTSNLVSDINIKLFKEFIPNQFFIGAKVEQYGKIMLGFNQPIQELSLKVINGEVNKDWYFPEYDSEQDTVWLWTNIEIEEDQILEVEISDAGIILDTIELSLQPLPQEEEDLNKLKPSISLKQNNGVMKYFEDIIFTSTTPLNLLNFNGILVHKNDTSIISNKDFNLSEDKKSFYLKKSLKQESHYSLFIYNNSISNIFGFKNDSLSFKFKTLSDIEYANLEVNIENNNENTKIIQLINESKNEILKEVIISSGEKVEFPNLSAGKYKLKMIFDENGNGKWDPGTFIPRKQPERVIYFSEELEMKEGWDKKIKWIIPE